MLQIMLQQPSILLFSLAGSCMFQLCMYVLHNYDDHILHIIEVHMVYDIPNTGMYTLKGIYIQGDNKQSLTMMVVFMLNSLSSIIKYTLSVLHIYVTYINCV